MGADWDVGEETFEECEEDTENHDNILMDYVIEEDDDDVVV